MEKKHTRVIAVTIFFLFLWGIPYSVLALPIPMGTLHNSNEPLNISTYDGSYQLTHPCVIYHESGWNGFTYLMVMTPYPYANPHYENPSMRYSNDGIHWEKLAGQPDPVIAQPSFGYNSDPSIELYNGRLFLFYRYCNASPDSGIININYYNYTTTTDGVTWTTPVKMTMDKTRSSSFIYNGTGWESWGHNTTTGNLVHFTTKDLTTWTKCGTTSLNSTTYVPWHSEVKKYDNQYQLLISDDLPMKNLRFYTSSDGLTWTYQNYNTPVLSGRSGLWDSQMYKASFVERNNSYEVWYSAFNDPWVARVGYTTESANPSLPVLNMTADPTSVTAGTPTPVRFTVKNTSSSPGISGATVTLTGAATGTGITGADGTATLSVNALRAGAITATAGKTGYTSTTTTVIANAAVPVSITVTSPNGGQSWARGTPHTVTWDYSGSPGSYVKILVLKSGIEVGTINGSTSIGSGGHGSYTWPIYPTGSTGSDYSISVQSTSQPIIEDTSNNYFTLTSAGTTSPTITVTAPNGGETWQRGTSHTVTWDYTGSPGSYVKILVLKSGVEVGTINASTAIGSNGKGSNTWSISSTGSTGRDYTVSVQSISQPTVKDSSNNYFTITPAGTITPSITVTSPNGGESWKRGTTHTVTWDFTGSPGSYVKIVLVKGGVEIGTIAGSVPVGTGGKGSYTWSISSSGYTGSDFKVSVQSISQPAIKDLSNNFFTLTL